MKPSFLLKGSVAALFFFFASIFLAWTPLLDPDVWFHLSTGRWMVESRAIPRLDTWTFTGSEPWITHEWLYELVLYGFYSLGGLGGIVAFKLVIVCLTLLAIERSAAARGTSLACRYGVLFLFGVLAQERFTDRPHLMTFLFSAVLIWLLETATKRYGSSDRLPLYTWLAVPLLWVWANMHSGILYGFLILAAYISALSQWRSRGHRSFFTIGAACLCVSLFTPNHIHGLLYPLTLLRNLKEAGFVTTEMLSPTYTSDLWKNWFVVALVFIALLHLKRMPRRDLILILTLSLVAQKWARERAYFYIVCAPFFALLMDQAISRWAAENGRSSSLQGLKLSCGGSLLVFALILGPVRSPAAMKEAIKLPGHLPASLVQYWERHQLPTRVFNAHGWGGYLTWATKGEMKVYIDGRLEIFPASVLRDYLSLIRGEQAERLLDEYDIECCILDPISNYPPPPSRSIYRTLLELEKWNRVYHDDSGSVFVRRASSP